MTMHESTFCPTPARNKDLNLKAKEWGGGFLLVMNQAYAGPKGWHYSTAIGTPLPGKRQKPFFGIAQTC